MTIDNKIHTKKQIQEILNQAVKMSNSKNEDNLYSEAEIFVFAKEFGLTEEGFKLALMDYEKHRKMEKAKSIIKHNMKNQNYKMITIFLIGISVLFLIGLVYNLKLNNVWFLAFFGIWTIICAFYLHFMSKNELERLAKSYVYQWERDGVEV